MGKLKMFKPGDLVPKSGVYAVFHSTPHRLIEHEAYVEGSRFRSCRTCPRGVCYRLQAPYIPNSSCTFLRYRLGGLLE